MLKKIIDVLLLVALVALIAGMFTGKSVTPSLGYQPGQSTVITSATNASTTVGSTAALITATNTARVLLMITNNGTSTVYVNLRPTAIANSGIPLYSSSTFRMDAYAGVMYTGAVYGITSSGSSTVDIIEK